MLCSTLVLQNPKFPCHFLFARALTPLIFLFLLLPGLVRFDALSPTSFPAIGFFRDQLGMQERLKHGVAADGCSPREDARHQAEGESCRQKRKENNVCVFCHPV